MLMASTASKQTHKNAHGQRGQAILEFLPVLSVFLLLTFAVIDFGRAIWQQETITALTREGSDVASRTTPVNLASAVTAVISDGVALNLSGTCTGKYPQCGEVIITSVQNTTISGSQAFVMTGQAFGGNLNIASKIGTWNKNGSPSANKVTLSAESIPGVTVQIPQPGATAYVTEVYDSYSPITPLGSFLRITMPSTLYDVAYF